MLSCLQAICSSADGQGAHVPPLFCLRSFLSSAEPSSFLKAGAENIASPRLACEAASMGLPWTSGSLSCSEAAPVLFRKFCWGPNRLMQLQYFVPWHTAAHAVLLLQLGEMHFWLWLSSTQATASDLVGRFPKECQASAFASNRSASFLSEPAPLCRCSASMQDPEACSD